MTTQLGSILARAITEYSNKPAIYCDNKPTLSYKALGELLDSITRQLQDAHIQNTHRVAILLPQGPENALLCLALMQYCCAVPLNPAATGDDIEALLSQRKISALVTDSEQFPHIRGLTEKLEITRLDVDLQPDNGDYLSLNTAQSSTTSHHHEHGALLLHTSGSTAQPKAVPLNESQLIASIKNLNRSLALGSNDRCINNLPLFHIGGLLDMFLAPLCAGGSIYFLRDMHSESFLKAMQTFLPTWSQAVPTMIQDLSRRAHVPRSPDLRFCRSVSAPLPASVKAAFEERFQAPVVEIYGMTETAGVITSNPLHREQQLPGSVGRAVGGEVMIADVRGNAAKAGIEGEVLIRGNNVFSGYEGEDKRLHFIGEWFRSGDIGYLDENKNLFLTGRSKDIINRGGEKLSPRQIDECLMRIPGIQDAACFAVPHPSLGEEVAAAWVASPANPAQEAEIRAALSSQLPGFKIPRQLFRLDNLPRTAGGKLQRHILSERYSTKKVASRKVPPSSELGTRIAQLWEDILGIDQIGVDDHFFELGGDSLKAATFITELSTLLGCDIPALALFDHPSIATLEAHLQTLDINDNALPHPLISSAFPQAMYRALSHYMAAWQGHRARPNSLIVGHNTLGPKVPLFWGTQSFEELSCLTTALGNDQPVYGFRSLFKVPGKTDRQLHALAAYLTREITAIQADGPYIIGGFCAGALLSFEIARQLQNDGKSVALLIMAEERPPATYSGRVCMLYSCNSRYSPFRHFQHPERGLRYRCSGEVSVSALAAKHRDFLREDNIDAVAAILRNEMDTTARAQPSPNQLSNTPAFLQPITPVEHQSAIQLSSPRWLPANTPFQAKVSFCNNSNQDWPAYAQSGLCLILRWRSSSGKVRNWQAGYLPIDQNIGAGEHFNTEIRLTTPDKLRRWTLEGELACEGLSLFSEQGIAPGRTTIFVHPNLRNRFTTIKNTTTKKNLSTANLDKDRSQCE
ncbi:AMP-binding protein [Spongiibacter tropicus]|uniref:AMP-binding protein n=2 Tax=Spongiibacter tropicus TaxID=454602 RepID=UPI003A98D4AC